MASYGGKYVAGARVTMACRCSVYSAGKECSITFACPLEVFDALLDGDEFLKDLALQALEALNGVTADG